jgi:L-ribulose-5-phosphate 3-epimerase
MHRRTFITGGAALAAGSLRAAGSPQFRKSIAAVIFPREMPVEEQFRRAKDAGFEGIELRMGDHVTIESTEDQLRRWGDAARTAGITIVSLWVSEPLSSNPLNSPDAAVRARGVLALEKSIDLATWLGCGALLIVPCRLGDGPKLKVGYQDTWDRVTEEFKKVIPRAATAKVMLTPENVWNKFLVSPLEMRAFVDQFHSPWLQTHFDIGNVMQFGYPEDWILTLGPRIQRIHVKDYKLSARAEQGRFVDLLEGDVNWKGVMAALVKVGYRGFMSPEIGHRDDPDQLRKVSAALDKILAMAA